MIAVPARVVVVPADRNGRFARHEAFAAACELDDVAVDDPADSGQPMAAAPTLAQLCLARGLGLITGAAPERTATVVAPRDALALARTTGAGFYEILVDGDGPLTVAPLSTPAGLRRAWSPEPAPRWARAQRPCVVRDGRGVGWPVTRLVRGGARTGEPAMIDGERRWSCAHVDGGWALIGPSPDERPWGWVPAAALVPEERSDVAA